MVQTTLNFDAPADDARKAHAQVWLWCAHLMRHEANVVQYDRPWPPPEGWNIEAWHAEIDQLEAAGDRFYAKAQEVAGDLFNDDSWREALEAFSG